MIASLLISVLVITAISVVLALLMVIADATVGNYGVVKININDKKELEVAGGQPLLKALNSEGVFIPSACGGRGSCGLCKVRVIEGGGNYLPTELPWISEEEKKNQVRLSCQFKVKNDVSIMIPEELFSVRQFETKVESIRDLTHDIKEVRLKLIEPSEIEMRAGQFIQFQVPAYELTDEPVYRAYSMASVPSDTNHIELEIRLVPNGICTTYVHKHLKEGDSVTVNGPYGEFFLRDTDRDIICIAGGSGMAPLKSILLDMAEKKSPRKARYFFGARTGKDLFLLDEMKALEDRMENFKFIPALSEPQPEDNWSGETGLITDVVKRMTENASESEAYLCGSPGMIDACIKVLQELGMPEERIYYDKFA
ncbi:NADH:ubiquinone reductase (Na(+)-transporting) subunit F [Pleomorphochaeta sp. DL1XJH-081]|jgi:Na+-transporting NADH:ubiquinone oxidoreductase subunit F|uniref:NADH:ubiquinone reductase (Na(+)-transporting) subunit F n=1 Tax=Pleomorphochaeta sp. DL1XJH-081 TaxID=3409690 RepID=UPI003BB588F9